MMDRGLSYAETLAQRLDKPMGALGLVFVLVVLGQSLTQDPQMSTTFTVIGWILWSVFAAEFVLRAYVARDQRRFWRRNWWQLVFLAVPFLRFVRAFALLRYLRVARLGGVVSSAIRGSRSARRLLSGRVAWLAVVTGIVVLACSQLLYLSGAYASYGPALHDAALATITGEPLSATTGFAQVLDVILAAYSVAVFATLAAAVGAYFLQRPGPGRNLNPSGVGRQVQGAQSSSTPT